MRLIQEGVLIDFINWVLLYPLTKWGSIIGYVQMELSTKDWIVILLLFAPLIFGFFTNRNLLKDKVVQVLLLFLTAAAVTVYPRFSFFHFQTALAVLVILYGYLLSNTKITVPIIAYLSISVIFIFFLIHTRVLLFDFQKEVRFYGRQDLELAQVIASQVAKKERVYLLGLPSNLYVMADRLPPKRWSDNFPWYLEIPGVQKEITSRWDANPPQYVFWRTPSPGNEFNLGTYQPKKIVSWINENYTKKEEVKPGIWLWVLRQAQD